MQRLTETEAVKEIEASLAKGPRRGAKSAEAADATESEAAEDETIVEEEAA